MASVYNGLRQEGRMNPLAQALLNHFSGKRGCL
jgi:hypothetical protein